MRPKIAEEEDQTWMIRLYARWCETEFSVCGKVGEFSKCCIVLFSWLYVSMREYMWVYVSWWRHAMTWYDMSLPWPELDTARLYRCTTAVAPEVTFPLWCQCLSLPSSFALEAMLACAALVSSSFVASISTLNKHGIYSTLFHTMPHFIAWMHLLMHNGVKEGAPGVSWPE